MRYVSTVPVVIFVLFLAVSSAMGAPEVDNHDPSNITHSALYEDSAGQGDYYFDTDVLNDGRVLGAFLTREVECQRLGYPESCIRTGAIIFHPANGSVSWQYDWIVPDEWNSEVHDTEYLPERNEVLIADMHLERVFAVDVETKRVTWLWNATSYYDTPPGYPGVDWLHINDVDVVGEGEYLLSVRNTNQLLFINRSCTCVTEVVNEDGNPRVMNHQHNPQLLEQDRILVADSENDRIVELQERDGRWVVAWTLNTAGGTRFDWPRDADRLQNGNTLVADTYNRRIVEVDEYGVIVRQLKIENGHVYDADIDGREYPAGPPNENRILKLGKQPLGTISWLYGGMMFWAVRFGVPVPTWLNEWHLLAFVITGVVSTVSHTRN